MVSFWARNMFSLQNMSLSYIFHQNLQLVLLPSGAIFSQEKHLLSARKFSDTTEKHATTAEVFLCCDSELIDMRTNMKIDHKWLQNQFTNAIYWSASVL